MKVKCLAYIKFKDGSGTIAEYKLENNLPFSLSEMRMWIKEQSNKSIESIEFLNSKNYRRKNK